MVQYLFSQGGCVVLSPLKPILVILSDRKSFGTHQDFRPLHDADLVKELLTRFDELIGLLLSDIQINDFVSKLVGK